MLLEFADSGCPIFRATTPLSRSILKSKGHGELSIHFTADYPTIETILRQPDNVNSQEAANSQNFIFGVGAAEIVN